MSTGNSVCPDVAEALYRAALVQPPMEIRRRRDEAEIRRAA